MGYHQSDICNSALNINVLLIAVMHYFWKVLNVWYLIQDCFPFLSLFYKFFAEEIRRVPRTLSILFQAGYLNNPFKYSFRETVAFHKTSLKLDRIVGPRSWHYSFIWRNFVPVIVLHNLPKTHKNVNLENVFSAV